MTEEQAAFFARCTLLMKQERYEAQVELVDSAFTDAPVPPIEQRTARYTQRCAEAQRALDAVRAEMHLAMIASSD